MQRFNTRNYSVRDFEEWEERGELTLAPKFQRRDVWNGKARSYLIDTIIRGMPIPKIYMRQAVNPKTRRTVRELVDGQQRLRAVLIFLKDGFKISRAHHKELGGRSYSQLPLEVQSGILQYEFVVDLLQDMPDNEVYDVFARINTYGEKLKPQELRHAKWFGDFRSAVYSLAVDTVTFFEKHKIFTSKQVLRMAEAEFISELLLAMQEGIRESKTGVVDKAYSDYDDSFPGRDRHEDRFKAIIDMIGNIAGADLAKLDFRATRLFYPLFCALHHFQYGLPRLQATRKLVKSADYPKIKVVLEDVSSLIAEVAEAERSQEELDLTQEQKKFFAAYDEHWVHAPNRTAMTQYLCRQFLKAIS